MPDDLQELRRLEVIAERLLQTIRAAITQQETEARRHRRALRIVPVAALLTGTTEALRHSPRIILAGAGTLATAGTAATILLTQLDGHAATDAAPAVTRTATPDVTPVRRSLPPTQTPAATFTPAPAPSSGTPPPPSGLPTSAVTATLPAPTVHVPPVHASPHLAETHVPSWLLDRRHYPVTRHRRHPVGGVHIRGRIGLGLFVP